jgi:hypothetical protein
MSAPKCANGFELRTIPANKLGSLDDTMVPRTRRADSLNLLNTDGSLSFCVAPCDDRTIPRLSLPQDVITGVYAHPLNIFNQSYGFKCMSPPIMNYDLKKVDDVLTGLYGSYSQSSDLGIPSSATCNKGALVSYKPPYGNNSSDSGNELTCLYNAPTYLLKMPK